MQNHVRSLSALPALGQSAGTVLVPTAGSGEARNLTPQAGKVQNYSDSARVELDISSFVHEPITTNANDKSRCALPQRTALDSLLRTSRARRLHRRWQGKVM